MGLGKTVAEILELPLSEYENWKLYYSEHPFGSWRDNYHASIIAALIHNVHSKDPKMPSDFFFRSAKKAEEHKIDSFMGRLLAMSKPADE